MFLLQACSKRRMQMRREWRQLWISLYPGDRKIPEGFCISCAPVSFCCFVTQRKEGAVPVPEDAVAGLPWLLEQLGHTVLLGA